MRVIDILNLRPIIDKIVNTRYSNYKVARNLALLKIEIDKEIDIYTKEEYKLLSKYASVNEEGKIIIDDNKNIIFDNDENRINYANEIQKVQTTEININFEKFSICEYDYIDSNDIPTPFEMVELIDFVEWI